MIEVLTESAISKTIYFTGASLLTSVETITLPERTIIATVFDSSISEVGLRSGTFFAHEWPKAHFPQNGTARPGTVLSMVNDRRDFPFRRQVRLKASSPNPNDPKADPFNDRFASGQINPNQFEPVTIAIRINATHMRMDELVDVNQVSLMAIIAGPNGQYPLTNLSFDAGVSLGFGINEGFRPSDSDFCTRITDGFEGFLDRLIVYDRVITDAELFDISQNLGDYTTTTQASQTTTSSGGSSNLFTGDDLITHLQAEPTFYTNESGTMTWRDVRGTQFPKFTASVGCSHRAPSIQCNRDPLSSQCEYGMFFQGRSYLVADQTVFPVVKGATTVVMNIYHDRTAIGTNEVYIDFKGNKFGLNLDGSNLAEPNVGMIDDQGRFAVTTENVLNPGIFQDYTPIVITYNEAFGEANVLVETLDSQGNCCNSFVHRTSRSPPNFPEDGFVPTLGASLQYPNLFNNSNINGTFCTLEKTSVGSDTLDVEYFLSGGYLREFLLFNRTLSSTDKQEVLTSLNSRRSFRRHQRGEEHQQQEQQAEREMGSLSDSGSSSSSPSVQVPFSSSEALQVKADEVQQLVQHQELLQHPRKPLPSVVMRKRSRRRDAHSPVAYLVGEEERRQLKTRRSATVVRNEANYYGKYLYFEEPGAMLYSVPVTSATACFHFGALSVEVLNPNTEALEPENFVLIAINFIDGSVTVHKAESFSDFNGQTLDGVTILVHEEFDGAESSGYVYIESTSSLPLIDNILIGGQHLFIDNVCVPCSTNNPFLLEDNSTAQDRRARDEQQPPPQPKGEEEEKEKKWSSSAMKSRHHRPHTSVDDFDDKVTREYEKSNVSRREVIGSDDRVVIDEAQSARYPFRTVACITYKNSDGSAPSFPQCDCSGILVSRRHVLTAGHCIHAGPSGDWLNIYRVYIKVYSGQQIDDGVVFVYNWKSTFIVAGWVEDGATDWDFGLIQLYKDYGSERKYPGDRHGWMSFGFNLNIQTTTKLHAIGYPGDKIDSNDRAAALMWKAKSSSHDSVESTLINHNIDTKPGMSGSAVYFYDGNDASRTVYGIHRGYDSAGDHNVAVRIDVTRYALLCDWISQDQSVC